MELWCRLHFMTRREKSSVLELSPVDTVLIRCFGEPSVLDGFPAVPGAAACRVARDELILLGPSAANESLISQARAYLERVDRDGLVIPHTDAWSLWMISGEKARAAFARLSANALPRTRPAFIQGAIAHLPGKALALQDYIIIMVPSTLGHHLPERVLAACADLNPQQREIRPLGIDSAVVVSSRPARTGQ
jgi:hypothetical protein